MSFVQVTMAERNSVSHHSDARRFQSFVSLYCPNILDGEHWLRNYAKMLLRDGPVPEVKELTRA